MATEPSARVGRYETAIATLIGLFALCVSGYTAYMQRQQVRAAVWPILEFDTSNGPMIRFTVDNKGVGPAIIRRVVVTVDGQPVQDWKELLDKLIGPGMHKFSESGLSGHVYSAGESVDVLIPHDSEGNPLTIEKSDPLWTQLNKERFRVAVEICYCSTLGECWTLRSGGKAGISTTEASNCKGNSGIDFQQ